MRDPQIVLFNPAPRSGWQAYRRVELPLGLLYPATPLDREGYSVRIIDQYADPDWKRDFDEALTRRPLCFGVTSMTGPQIHYALQACAALKKRHPGVPVVWGGIHGSLLPEQTLAHPLVDIVVEGEGEETLLALVRALERGASLSQVAGIWYKDGAGLVRTAPRDFFDLERLPPLSYRLVKVPRYARRLFGVEHLSFNSSRGCAYRCKFCWDPVMHRGRWRAMRPATVMSHLEQVVREYGVRGFLFTDDNFFLDMDRAYGILQAVVRSGMEITIGKLQARADAICKMDRDFLELLVKAGVHRLTIGVESGSQRILDMIHKDETVESMLEANRRLAPFPIVPLCFFMMGFPTETPDEVGQSIRLAARLMEENPNADVSFNIYSPYPGTALFRMAVEHGLPEPRSLQQWARTNFRKVPPKGAHVPTQTRKLIAGLDFPLMFMGKLYARQPYRNVSSLPMRLGRFYLPIAKYRVRNLEPGFPIETKLVKALGLFGREL